MIIREYHLPAQLVDGNADIMLKPTELNKNITNFVFWYLRPLAMYFGGPYVYVYIDTLHFTIQFNMASLLSSLGQHNFEFRSVPTCPTSTWRQGNGNASFPHSYHPKIITIPHFSFFKCEMEVSPAPPHFQ